MRIPAYRSPVPEGLYLNSDRKEIAMQLSERTRSLVGLTSLRLDCVEALCDAGEGLVVDRKHDIGVFDALARQSLDDLFVGFQNPIA